MNDFKKFCKAAGIVEIILGIILHISILYFLIAIIVGVILLVYSSKSYEEIISNKTKLIITSIVAFFTNPIAGILMIIAFDKLKDYENGVNSPNSPPNTRVVIKKKQIDPEVKKIDILLKLGVGMVFVSGILFATTSWDFISNLSKAIALVILGTLFLALSRFSENKLKLYNTTYMYWILGMAFYLLTIIGMLYFGVIGDKLTYAGSHMNLSYAITFFTLTGLSLATYLKFSQKGLLYVVYTSILLMCVNILLGLNIPMTIIILLITIISLLINIFIKTKSTLSNFNIIISYALIAFIYTVMMESNSLLFLVTCIFIIINITYLSVVKKDELLSIVTLAASYYIMFLAVCNLGLSTDIKYTIITTLSMAYAMYLKFNVIETSKSYEIINYIVFTTLSIILSFMTSPLISIIMIVVYLIANYFAKSEILNTQSIKFAKIAEPFAIFMLIVHVYDLASETTPITFASICVFATLIYTFARLVSKEEITKRIYNIASYTGIILFFAASTYDYDKFPAVAIVVPCAYHFFASLKSNKNNKGAHILLYLLTLYSIYNALYILDVFEIGKIISAIIFIWVLAIAIYVIQEQYIDKVSYFVLALPLYNIIEELQTKTSISVIMYSVLILYFTFLIIKFFCKEEKSKEIISIVGIVIAVLSTLETPDLIIGLYVGIIGLLTTIIGYYKKDSKGLFITGIVITILNIIYQLKEFWGQIPFWLYLLVGGLGIIFFVTYREVKKLNKK